MEYLYCVKNLLDSFEFKYDKNNYCDRFAIQKILCLQYLQSPRDIKKHMNAISCTDI